MRYWCQAVCPRSGNRHPSQVYSVAKYHDVPGVKISGFLSLVYFKLNVFEVTGILTVRSVLLVKSLRGHGSKVPVDAEELLVV